MIGAAPTVPSTAVVCEPAFGRWHVTLDCPVLRAQPDAAVESRGPADVEGRPCTICLGNALPPA